MEGFAGFLGGDEHVEVHIVKARGCIAATTERLDSSVEFTGAKRAAAFEHHVFQEMGHAVLLVLFNGTACAAPELKTGHGRIEHRQQGQRQTVAERGGVWGAVAKPCGLIQRIKAADVLTMAIPPWVCAI